MPKSYDAWRTQGPPETDHFKACPCHDDAEPVCKSCGNGCPESDHIGEANEMVCKNVKHLCEGFTADEDPDCICSELEDDNGEHHGQCF